MLEYFKISHFPQRISVGKAILKAFPPTVAYLTFAWLMLLALPERAWQIKSQTLIAISLFGIWRYSWQVTNVFRHWRYRRHVFPALRAEADALEDPFPDRLFVMIPSYHEDYYVTEMIFNALVRDVCMLPCKVVFVASVGSSKEAEFIRKVVAGIKGSYGIKLIIMQQHQGKRIAMGHALRAIAREFNDPFMWHPKVNDDVVVFMDGDTLVKPGTFSKCLPFFKLHPQMAALTTDNIGLQQDSTTLFHDWYSLKFAQRNHQFYSHALSKRMLTLTGRFSMFRASIVVKEEFIRFVEADYLESWMYGRFRFLMGDDKSTWFYLLKKGYEMLYVPDAPVIAVETRQEHFFSTSISLMRRWYGNMLCNNLRAIKLGPRPMGKFIWWSIVDQRLTTWTPLVGPASMIMMSLFISPFYLVFYTSWIICTRLVMLWVYVLEGFELRTSHLPLMLFNQWVGAALKVITIYNLDKQTWNKKNKYSKSIKKKDSTLNRVRYILRTMLIVMNFTLLLTFCGLGTGALTLPSLAELTDIAPMTVQKNVDQDTVVVSMNIAPDADVGQAVMKELLRSNKNLPLRLEIPAGHFVIDTPIIISRNNVILKGAGQGKTFLRSCLNSDQGEAVLHVLGKKEKRIGRLKEPLPLHSSMLTATKWHKGNEFIWIGVSNDEEFLDSINAVKWRKTRPPLRQYIGRVEDSISEFIMMRAVPGIEFPAGTEVYAPKMVTNVIISNFSLEQKVPKMKRKDVQGRYENLAEKYALDGVRFEWAADCMLKDVNITMAGRHPIAFESCKEITVDDVIVDGVWNKGKKGNGYVRFARSFGCSIQNSIIRNIRHLTFQWGSSGNLVENCIIETDINFHGGFSHDNTVRHCTFSPPKWHHWGKITRMPEGGGTYAPPDGDRNRVEE
ncbi:glycosyltransferase [Maridesulfovibrio sp.]|uniref:glycosyltransferase n=1 Tax=Maridesulfovibrio sp. TaxID=2795000 RepID=UPI0029CA463F|nr:glycosyltransferase [Maridesulfovibrio sp.]